MDLSFFFQIGPLPLNEMTGYYSPQLVALSYLIASMASYVALDITERIRTTRETTGAKLWWLIEGALAMGMGIWSMHFIGMLAFIMPMSMTYDPLLTGLSLLIAIIASAFALFLIRDENVKTFPLICGGVLLGLGIASMHYVGMSDMLDMKIRYLPDIFFLSILIAITASQAALWLMIQDTKVSRFHNTIKIGSSLVVGLAICGMHYTGMAAAIFTPYSTAADFTVDVGLLNPQSLSLFIGTMTIVIISIALFASKSWMNALQIRNQKLVETEAVLELKTLELERANENLKESIDHSLSNEGRMRAILSAAADGIIVADEEGKIEMSNQAAEKIFGYTATELVGQEIFKFLKLKNTQVEREDFSSLNLEDGGDTLYELSMIRKDNNVIPVELNFSKSVINDETLFIIVIRDITERKRAEEHLNNLNRKLFTAARMAGMAEVASCILHNVGNILNSINVSTQILLQRQSELKTNELSQIATLLEEHKKRNELESFLQNNRIGQILPGYLHQFAQLWNNEQSFMYKELDTLNNRVQYIKNIVNTQQALSGNINTFEKVNITDLIEDALTINSEKIDQYHIVINRRYVDIPEIEIDKVKAMQVFVNLIKNAIEALEESHHTEKTITLTIHKHSNNTIKIEVQDNGIGIESQNLTKIFSYGFTTKKEGHGFGLHSCALAMQQMGGSLHAASNGRDQGAVFSVTIPLKTNANQINDDKTIEKEAAQT